MLGPTTTLQDVLYGLYNWLIAHPSETILVSINQEAGSNTPYDKKFEEILFATINNELGKKFWLPVSGEVMHVKLNTPQRLTSHFHSARDSRSRSRQTCAAAAIYVPISVLSCQPLWNPSRCRAVDAEWRGYQTCLQPDTQESRIYPGGKHHSFCPLTPLIFDMTGHLHAFSPTSLQRRRQH